MADFCKQCSMELFGEDFGDLAGLGGDAPIKEGHGYAVICEGCGPTLVDEEGRCIEPGCEKHGGEENDDEYARI